MFFFTTRVQQTKLTPLTRTVSTNITLAVELIVIICVIYPSRSPSLPKLPRLTKLWFTCCCLQKCCNISDKFIHVLVLWNLVAFMQLFFAGVTLRVLPLLASDVFLTTMGISLLVSGGFCLLMLLASLLHVSRSFKLVFCCSVMDGKLHLKQVPVAKGMTQTCNKM